MAKIIRHSNMLAKEAPKQVMAVVHHVPFRRKRRGGR
jgi:hypothetical protein